MPLLKTPRDVTGVLERAWTRGSSASLGYGVPGLDFDSGALLAFARLPDEHGRPATWLWHRGDGGCWTTYRDGPEPPPSGQGRPSRAATAPAVPEGSEASEGREPWHGPVPAEIRIGWRGRGALSVSLSEHRIHWSLRLRATSRTRALTILGLMLPDGLRKAAVGSPLAGPVAEWLLGAAEAPPVFSVRSPEGHIYRIEPRRVWLVEASAAVVGGRELGSVRAVADVGGAGAAPSALAGEPVFLCGRTDVRREGARVHGSGTGTGAGA